MSGWSAATSTKRRWATSWMPFVSRFCAVSVCGEERRVREALGWAGRKRPRAGSARRQLSSWRAYIPGTVDTRGTTTRLVGRRKQQTVGRASLGSSLTFFENSYAAQHAERSGQFVFWAGWAAGACLGIARAVDQRLTQGDVVRLQLALGRGLGLRQHHSAEGLAGGREGAVVDTGDLSSEGCGRNRGKSVWCSSGLGARG